MLSVVFLALLVHSTNAALVVCNAPYDYSTTRIFPFALSTIPSSSPSPFASRSPSQTPWPNHDQGSGSPKLGGFFLLTINGASNSRPPILGRIYEGDYDPPSLWNGTTNSFPYGIATMRDENAFVAVYAVSNGTTVIEGTQYFFLENVSAAYQTRISYAVDTAVNVSDALMLQNNTVLVIIKQNYVKGLLLDISDPNNTTLVSTLDILGSTYDDSLLLNNGNFVILYKNSNTSFAQIYEPSGSIFGSPFPVAGTSAASLANGGFVTVWMTGNETYFQIFDNNGSLIIPSSLVNSRSYSYRPQVTGLSDGTFLVTWVEINCFRQDRGIKLHCWLKNAVMGNLYNSSGSLLLSRTALTAWETYSYGEVSLGFWCVIDTSEMYWVEALDGLPSRIVVAWTEKVPYAWYECLRAVTLDFSDLTAASNSGIGTLPPCWAGTPSPTSSATPSVTPSSSSTRSPSVTPSTSLSQSATPSPTSSVTPTASATPSASITPTVTSSVVPTTSASPSVTLVASTSRSPSTTVTPTASSTATPSESFSRSPSASASPESPTKSRSTHTDMVLGLAIGGAFIAVAIGGSIGWYVMHKRNQHEYSLHHEMDDK